MSSADHHALLNSPLMARLRAQFEVAKARSEALYGERQRFAEFFEFAPSPYLVTDAFGVIEAGNRAAAELLAVPAPMLRRKRLPLFVELEMRPAFRRAVASLCSVPMTAPRTWRSTLRTREHRVLEVECRVRTLPASAPGRLRLAWVLQPCRSP